MVVVVQLVRTPDCGSGGRRFESGLPPKSKPSIYRGFFCCSDYLTTCCRITSILNLIQQFQNSYISIMKKPFIFIIGSLIGFIFAVLVKSYFGNHWDADMIFPTLLFGACAISLVK